VDLIACGKNMGLNLRKCKDVIANTRSVISNWMSYAQKSKITPKRSEEIDRILNMNNY